MQDTEWVPAERQPTYTPGEPGVTVVAIPTMVKLHKKRKPKDKDTDDSGSGTHK